jgi:hypothetical protein
MSGNRAIIDEHPERARIEADLARGVPVRTVARKYELSIRSCYRYREKIPPYLRAAYLGEMLKPGADLEKLRVETSEGILVNLASQMARLYLMQDQAMEAGDHDHARQLSLAIQRCIELQGKYLGEFAQHHVRTNINVLVSPEYLEIRRIVMQEVDAITRRRIAARLHVVEERAAQRQIPGHPNGAEHASAAA